MAGPYYVRSTDGDDGDDGLSWANAFATLGAGATAAGAGELVKASKNHAEVLTADATWAFAGTEGSPTLVICVDEDNSDVAVTGHSAGGSISGVANYKHIQITGEVYFWGLTLIWGDSHGYATGTGTSVVFEQCKLSLGVAAAKYIGIGLDNTNTHFTDTDYDASAHAGNELICAQPSSLVWRGGSLIGDPNNLIDLGVEGPDIQIMGVDLSTLAGGNIIEVASGDERFNLDVRGIKTNATTEPNLISMVPERNSNISMIIFDQSGSSAVYRFRKDYRYGYVYDETTKIFTGKGLYDGTNEYSLNIVPHAANAPTFYIPWIYELCAKRVTGLSGEKTFTVEFALDHASAQPTAWEDDEIWIEVWGVAASSAQMTKQMDRITKPTDTPAAQTASTGWASLSNGREQKCAVTVSAATWQDGPVQVFLCIGRTLPAATSLYVCPEVVVS